MAWLFLPENEQVQYLQKIALRAENPSGTIIFIKKAHPKFVEWVFILRWVVNQYSWMVNQYSWMVDFTSSLL
jgi:hypothetical protein